MQYGLLYSCEAENFHQSQEELAVQPHPTQPAAISQQRGHLYDAGATPCWVDHFLHPVRPKDLTSAVSFPELEGKKGVNLCLYYSLLVTVLSRSLRSVFAPFVYHLSISFQMTGPLGIFFSDDRPLRDYLVQWLQASPFASWPTHLLNHVVIAVISF